MNELLDFVKSSPVSTLLGVIVGGLVSFFVNCKLNRIKDKQVAGGKLRAAFAEELAILHPQLGHENVSADKVLHAALSKHTAAVIEYRFFLKGKQRDRFDQAWIDYYSANGDKRCAWFVQYEVGENARELFVERVNGILNFTEGR